MVTFSWKPNTVESSSRVFNAVIAGGMHVLFFFKVPTIVRSQDSKDFANDRVVK